MAPLNNRHTGSRWQECNTCGVEYPVVDMVRQNGVLVCVATCVDVRDHPGEAKVEETGSGEEVRLPDLFEPWF